MLNVDDVFVSYGQSEALHGISFNAAHNETVAIMGRLLRPSRSIRSSAMSTR